MQNNLFIDIGNSTIKWQYATEIKSVAITDFSLDKLPQQDYITSVWLAFVANSDIADNICNNYYKVNIVKSAKSYKKLQNCYQDISQLGVDRWLALIAVYELYPKQNILLLSTGTATTIDLLTKGVTHQGGLIMPSLGLLNNSFPTLVDNIFGDEQGSSPKINELANNTTDAWVNGCASLWLFGVNAMIDDLLKPSTKLVLTGGYAKFLMPHLTKKYTYHNNLVIKGLEFYSKNETTALDMNIR